MSAGCRVSALAGAVAVLIPSLVAAAGQPVSFHSLDGVTLSAQLYEPSARPAPGVVLVHMLSRSKADWDAVGSELMSAGIAVLALDLRGHGASEGSSSDPSRMVQDVRAAVEWLSARPGVRPGAMGLVGASLGANLVLQAAMELPTVRVVAAVSPSLEYRGVRVSPDLVRRLGSRAIWFAASTEDPYALRTVTELIGDATAFREQQLSPVAAHGTQLLDADRSLARALVDWLRQRLLF